MAGMARVRSRAIGRSVPPTGLVMMSIFSVQLGAALAKNLFAQLGPAGTVFLRIGFAAIILLAMARPRISGHTRKDWVAVLLFGLTIAGMNAAFYAAIARLPLGIAVTLEFVGPLSVAIAGSRRWRDLLWATLAAGGIAILTPWGNSATDSLGVVLALLAACGWAAYILLNVRVGRAFAGHDGLALSMAVACIAAVPLGVVGAGPAAGTPLLLLAGLGVAVLSTVVPFSLEHSALKQLPAQVFGVLMSVEPAVAALIGAIVLHEALGMRGLLALAMVSAASFGSARAPGSGA
jgi:inner membrane transporter RhtA